MKTGRRQDKGGQFEGVRMQVELVREKLWKVMEGYGRLWKAEQTS